MQETPQWRIAGDWFDNCSCDVACPCTFAQAPDNDFCESVLFWHIREGHYGDVSLDDLAFVRKRSGTAQAPRTDSIVRTGEHSPPSGVVPGTVGAPGGVDRRRQRNAPPPSLGDIDGPGSDAVSRDLPETPEEASSPQADVSPEPAPHPLDTPGFNVNRNSLVDRDDAPPVSPRHAVPKFRGYHAELAGSGDSASTKKDDDWLEGVPPFDSSLITNRDLDD